MNNSPSARKELQWFPTPRRRLIARLGLAFCAVFGLFKIFSIPWMWQYVDQIYLDVLFYTSLIITLLLVVMDLRINYPPGCCRNCGYNLTGNSSGVCPECGKKI